MKIDINKTYSYRNGTPARIICVDAPGSFPVISITESGNPSAHQENGRHYGGDNNSVYDLIEVREPREWEMHVKPGTQKVADIFEGSAPEARYPWEKIRVREIID